MKLNVYKCTCNPQYNQDAEIVIAHVCETKAVEMGEDIVKCALSIEKIGCIEYEAPFVIKNTFNPD